MTTVAADQARECTPEEGKRWQERYQAGYMHGKSDTLNPRATVRADLLIDIPAEVPGECGARYVARHLELAYPIAYTRAVAWYSAHPHGVAIGECPQCGTSPAYRRVLPDPWDRHEVCPECGYCYSHNH